MTDRRYLMARIVVYMVMALLFAGLQTSLWFHVFGKMPSPLFWLTLTVYLSIYREFLEGLVSVYLVSVVLSVFTFMPFGLLSLLLLSMFFLARFFRARFFWPGSTFFMVACGSSVPTYYILHMIGSFMVEANSITHFELLRWILQASETTIVALFVFPLYEWIDSRLTEEGGEAWGMHE